MGLTGAGYTSGCLPARGAGAPFPGPAPTALATGAGPIRLDRVPEFDMIFYVGD